MTRRSLLPAVGLLLACGVRVPAVHGQTPGTDGKNVAFEAVSIRANTSGVQFENFDALPGGRFVATNVTVGDMIRVAYGTAARALVPGQLAGGPRWISTDRFDVVGKAAGNASRGELWLMLRTLLADRFSVAVHTETREQPIYALVLARSDGRLGPNIRRSDADCPSTPAPVVPSELASCQVRMSTGKRSGRAVTMAELARSLAGGVGGRDVRDQTGLSGRFDVDVEWTPDAVLLATPPPPDATSIFTAVEEQLGLKLKSTTGRIEVLIVDRVEHPTAD